MWRVPSLPVAALPWLLLHGKGLPWQGTTASLWQGTTAARRRLGLLLLCGVGLRGAWCGDCSQLLPSEHQLLPLSAIAQI